MSAYLKLPATEDANGNRFAAHHDSGRTAAIFIPAHLLTSKAFGPSVGALRSSAAIFALGAPATMESLSAIGWDAQAPKQLEPVARAAGTLLQDGRKQKIELQRQRADMLQPPKRLITKDNEFAEFARQMEQSQRNAEIRAHLQTLKSAERVKAILDNIDFAIAVVDAPNISGVPAEIMDRVEKNVIIHNLTQRTASNAQKKASISDLFAVGDDVDAARERALASIAMHEKDVAEVNAVQGVVSDAVDYIAVAANVPRFAAFEMVAA